ncbi:MAG: sodium ion-translocating decarboxylase subunit beta [Clostridiales bacterium]|nr:sodium ion-translocating decarboxylase subunit beta [Clostridiales bacterium]
MEVFFESIQGLINDSGFINLDWKSLVMIGISCVLVYLAVVKQFEPLLLLPIAFGMLLTNIPCPAEFQIFHMDFFVGKEIDFGKVLHEGGLLDILYLGVKLGVYPPLIFLGIGTMTDFGPLIANPKSFLLGAAAQAGIFVTFIGAMALGFTPQEAGGIGIIGGADGPTAILVAKELAPALLGSIAVAAYSYMALVPVIQPPIMKALTTKKERSVVMEQLRPVSKVEKLIFPILVTLIICFVVPSATPLIGMLMLGNLMKESGVVDRLVKTAQNELMNIVTIMLGVTVGATATADYFLTWNTIKIIALGLAAFCIGTAAGVLFGKVMYVVTKGKVNPLIGAAGVSAVPMAARVAQKVGQKENPKNFLLMHAMGPNVAGVIGSAVAAGVLLSIFAK